MTRPIIAAIILLSIAAIATDKVAAQTGPHADAPPSGRVQKGAASFYAPKDAGKPTASGDPLVLNRMTAASPTLPLGTKAKVTNTESGKSTHVTITDRGPYAKGRIIDVTPKAAERLGMKHKGVAPVVVKPVSKTPSPERQSRHR